MLANSAMRHGSQPILLLTLGCAVLLCSEASAYLRPASSILEDVGKQRARLGFKTMVLEGHEGTAAEPQRRQVWWAFKTKVGQRLEFSDATRKFIVLTRGDERFRFVEGDGPGAAEPLPTDLIRDFLANTSGDRYARRGLRLLKANKIDAEQVHLGRMDGRIAYIIGARSTEPDQPQLWIDKALRVPVRLITYEGGTKVDFRLRGFGSPITGHWFPRRIERWVGERLESALEITKLTLNESVASELFKPQPSRR